jgi:lipid II:glycine glycyltransferase (peptidoglycan interpeptide bridge formation enzyme)
MIARLDAGLDVVWTPSLLPTDGDDYDRFVAESRSGHYAQTRAFWPVAREARSSTARYVLVRERGRVIGAALVVRPRFGPVSLPWAEVERGPVCQNPSDLARVASALARKARTRGVLGLSLMPYWADADADAASRALREAGFRETQRHDGAHALTLRIDLSRSGKGEDVFFARPGQERLRKRSTQAAKAGAVARRGTRADFDEHRHLTDLMMRAQGKSVRSRAYYEALWSYMRSDEANGPRGVLFVGELEGRTLASVVVLRHGANAVYAQGATTLEPSKISKSVPPLVAAVRWAQAQGCHTFDLGGIPDRGDTDPKRRRIAHLKLDFAREPVRLVRRHERVF